MGCAGAVEIGFAKSGEEAAAFDVLERGVADGVGSGGAALFGAEILERNGQVLELDVAGIAENEGVLDGILQFSNVAGPVVVEECLACFGGEIHGPIGMEPAGEVFDEGGDVFGAFAQGREDNGNDVEAIEEILSECAFAHEGFQVAVGGGDDAHVGLSGAGLPHRLKFAFLEDTEEFDLERGGDFTDFVKKDGAGVGGFEESLSIGDGASEGSFDVAEERAFKEGFGESAAVDFDEGSAGARGESVDGVGEDFLSGAAFTAEKDGGVGAGDAGEAVEDFLHEWALGDNTCERFGSGLCGWLGGGGRGRGLGCGG